MLSFICDVYWYDGPLAIEYRHVEWFLTFRTIMVGDCNRPELQVKAIPKSHSGLLVHHGMALAGSS